MIYGKVKETQVVVFNPRAELHTLHTLYAGTYWNMYTVIYFLAKFMDEG